MNTHVAVAERIALLFSDGSMTVGNAEWSLEMAQKERIVADANAPRAVWTKIALVKVEVVNTIFDPSIDEQVEISEIERLRLENAALRAEIEERSNDHS